MDLLLILNTGSSSVKFRLFRMDQTLALVAGGKVTDIGGAAVFEAALEQDMPRQLPLPRGATQEDAVHAIVTWLDSQKLLEHVSAAAHRIVHGGDAYADPVLLTAETMNYLRGLDALAPLHQPHNLAGADILAAAMPHIPQYGCFDTAFHARHDPLFYSFALPKSLRDKGMRRYGFHGLSYDWIVDSLRRDYPHLLPKRVVIAHLGNGASLCAVKDGRSIDTTMSMTVLDGLPMGTRSGAIDPGAVIYMIRALGLPVDEAERILYEDSGLKGLSSISNDVKTLSDSSDENAVFALDYFALKTAQHIATMAVSAGGLDALVFTGGIGENATGIRQAIIARLSFLPPFETHVIATNEERCMAQQIYRNFIVPAG